MAKINALNFIDEASLAAGTTFDSTNVRDLSAIVYDSSNDVYYVVSNDKTNPRFYTLDIDLTGSAIDAVTITDVTTLNDAGGTALADNTTDLEGIALTNSGTIFLASEGVLDQSGTTANHIDPFIREFNLASGNQVDDITIPTKFIPEGVLSDSILITTALGNPITPTTGVRSNLALESLTLTADEQFLFTATEAPLAQDSSSNNIISGGTLLNRIVQFEPSADTYAPTAEYLYVPAAFHNVTDILALDSETLIVVERNPLAASGLSNTFDIQIYEADLSVATDISGTDGLNNDSSGVVEVAKTLLVDFDDLNIDGNFEGLSFGSDVNGNPSLIVVSDNGGTEASQFVAFEVDLVTDTQTPDLIVFGNSLADTGNSFDLTGIPPSPPYFDGRSSNGLLAAEIFAAEAGLNLAQENNYAFIGSTTGRDNDLEQDTGLELPGLLDQIDQFAATLGDNGADADDTYFIWAGSNDIIGAFLAGNTDINSLITEMVTNLVTAVSTLNALGAENILLPNLFNLGFAPGFEGFEAQATAITVAFNSALETALDSLDFDVNLLDFFSVSNVVAANPEDFDFSNIETLLLSEATTPNNPEEFFFFDFGSLTTQGHNIFAQAISQTLAGQAFEPFLFSADLTGSQEVDPGDGDATGTAQLRLNELGTGLRYTLNVSGLDFGNLAGVAPQTPQTDDDVVGLHIHQGNRGENGDVVLGIVNPAQDEDDFTVVINDDGSATISGIWDESDPANQSLSNFVTDLRSTPDGEDTDLYFNIHTEGFPSGAIRGQIAGGEIDTTNDDNDNDTGTTNLTVTIENLTPANGLYLAQFWLAFHDGNFDVFNVGEAASRGLEILAEDGITGLEYQLDNALEFVGEVASQLDIDVSALFPILQQLTDAGIDLNSVISAFTELQNANLDSQTQQELIDTLSTLDANADLTALVPLIAQLNNAGVDTTVIASVFTDIISSGVDLSSLVPVAEQFLSSDVDSAALLSALEPLLNSGIDFNTIIAALADPANANLDLSSLPPIDDTLAAIFAQSASASNGGEQFILANNEAVADLLNHYPGVTISLDVTLDNSDLANNRYFSYASMIAPSNDGFIGNEDPNGIEIFDAQGNFLGADITILGDRVWDAGTEVNDESPNSIPYTLDIIGQGVDENGTVQNHPGFLAAGSGGILDQPNHVDGDFTQPGYQIARITITETDNTTSATDLTLNADNSFVLGGQGQVNLEFNLAGVNAAFVNEIGVYKRETGQTTQDILTNGQTIFSALGNIDSGFGIPSRILSNFAAGDEIGFYLIADSTTDAVLAGEVGIERVILGSTATLQTIAQDGGVFNINFEDGGGEDFDDVQVTMTVTQNQPAVGSNLQGEIEVIDLREFAAQSINADIRVIRNASFNNVGGLYAAVDETGGVLDTLTGNVVQPGDANYAQVALAQSAVSFTSDNFAPTVLQGGSVYVPYILSDGNTDQFFSPFAVANPDGLEHIIGLGDNNFGFEDLLGGGDRDFNDFLFGFDFNLT